MERDLYFIILIHHWRELLRGTRSNLVGGKEEGEGKGKEGIGRRRDRDRGGERGVS